MVLSPHSVMQFTLQAYCNRIFPDCFLACEVSPRPLRLLKVRAGMRLSRRCRCSQFEISPCTPGPLQENPTTLRSRRRSAFPHAQLAQQIDDGAARGSLAHRGLNGTAGGPLFLGPWSSARRHLEITHYHVEQRKAGNWPADVKRREVSKGHGAAVPVLDRDRVGSGVRAQSRLQPVSHGNRPRFSLASRTLCTPIAIAAVLCGTWSRSARVMT